MLIEFRVENFRSLRDEQSLLLTAYTNKSNRSKELLDTNTFPCPAYGKDTRLVATAGIYGANASGKSNLCQAAQTFISMLSIPLLFGVSNTNYPPAFSFNRLSGLKYFMLDNRKRKEPTSFEITFVPDDNIIYQYGFKILDGLITEEWLYASPEGRTRTYFKRNTTNPKSNNGIAFTGDNLKGDKVSLAQKTTNENLFLNVAAAFNHEQLKPLHDWLCRHFHSRRSGIMRSSSPHRMQFMSESEPEFKKKVLEFLRIADLGIKDFVFEKTEDNDKESRLSLKFMHEYKDSESPVYFNRNEESAGTLRLFDMLDVILDCLNDGDVLFLDEIQASLHPLLTRKIISLFHDPEINKKNAQLIFTTHDTTIMDKSLMRRDQIWFMEKDPEGASHLYPLLDYSPKANESLSKGYLEGRYGAIPVIGNWSF